MADVGEGAQAVVRAGDIVAGKYIVEGLIERGGMAWVYAARRVDGGLPVALKVAPRGDGALASHTLAVEARALSRVRHPGVVAMRTFGVDGPWVYLELERVRGPSLAARLEEEALAPGEALAIFLQVAGALGAAHKAGIAHRDIKAGNVLLGAPCRSVLIDFGIAVGEGVADPREAVACGTPGAIAPEVAYDLAHDMEAFQLADQYALGALLRAMLLPDERSGASRSRDGDRTAVVVPPASAPLLAAVGAPLARVIERAMALSPEARFVDVPAFRAAVLAASAASSALRLEPLAHSVATARLNPAVDRARTVDDPRPTND